jgi:mutator protein MutT
VPDTPHRFCAALRNEIGERLASFPRETVPLEGRIAAAVAVAIISDDADHACFVLTRRAARLANHGGQWALPGGRVDGAETAAAAAVRELREEVGLEPADDGILGLLDDYPTRSGFVITPVVVWGGEDAQLVPDPGEVAAAYRIPIAELDRPGVPRLRRIPESDRPLISIPLVGTHVHAPTAAVIYQFREVGMYGRPTRVAHFEQPVFAWR